MKLNNDIKAFIMFIVVVAVILLAVMFMTGCYTTTGTGVTKKDIRIALVNSKLFDARRAINYMTNKTDAGYELSDDEMVKSQLLNIEVEMLLEVRRLIKNNCFYDNGYSTDRPECLRKIRPNLSQTHQWQSQHIEYIYAPRSD